MEALSELEQLLDHHGSRFLEVPRSKTPSGISLVGVPYDGTTSYRPGTRFGPEAIRAASIGLETYSPEQDADYTDGEVVDLGNLDVPYGGATPVINQVREAVGAIVDLDGIPLVLGGEHSITAGIVEALVARYPDLLVIQLDAHADLRDGYLGEHYSHASAMRRCLDALGEGGQLLQVGIRSGERAEFQELRESGRWLPASAEQLHSRLDEFSGRPIYVTLDLDIFDPAYFPGTGTPEPGGIDWATFAALLRTIPGDRMVGADVMELAPQLDTSGVSSVLAAKATRELIIKIQSQG
jgi:agmatinase